MRHGGEHGGKHGGFVVERFFSQSEMMEQFADAIENVEKSTTSVSSLRFCSHGGSLVRLRGSPFRTPPRTCPADRRGDGCFHGDDFAFKWRGEFGRV
jgi:hypothetical protein